MERTELGIVGRGLILRDHETAKFVARTEAQLIMLLSFCVFSNVFTNFHRI